MRQNIFQKKRQEARDIIINTMVQSGDYTYEKIAEIIRDKYGDNLTKGRIGQIAKKFIDNN